MAKNFYSVKLANADKITSKVHDRLEKLFSFFEEMDEAKILYIIWIFCFSPEYAWEKYCFPEEDFESSIEIVRRELLRMYKYLYPENWQELTAALSNDSERELSKKLSSIENAFYLIRRKLLNSEFSTKKDFERVLFLLSSEEEKYRFGGLSEIGFDKYASNILKDCAPEIGKVLAELYDGYPFEEATTTEISDCETPEEDSKETVVEEVKTTAMPKTLENAEDATLTDNKTDFERFVECQGALTLLKTAHTEYFKIFDYLLEKGFSREYLMNFLES